MNERSKGASCPLPRIATEKRRRNVMVGYITLFLWSVALFVVLVAVVYPRLMLRMKCSVKASMDRGIERIKGDAF